ncbi:unnamed protein product [Prunus armeniaca]|uniref:Uncharacterized protein n=1 Tax=Prunus armeniaca TaxID=36596 RepID=A0A6J5VZJ4_PRUAR|nr:unnamed protein product [Prunus armeniaca]
MARVRVRFRTVCIFTGGMRVRGTLGRAIAYGQKLMARQNETPSFLDNTWSGTWDGIGKFGRE